ncbi:Eukaryotic translation initiation factor 2 alpha kinase 4 [Desmophyllum pertusum]|uniref:Eukaryotic translation initiation factor 2 alpha kinase 4 n=1 Tax=Desmophyllum pertusum TaxID=174260 RepID=A0A9X0D5Q7_9CNID|nr:Eukaryotic translation initiation factor 2 alpha kinase 4 [Desmophyllum pertusum]
MTRFPAPAMCLSVSAGHNPMQAERMCIARDLWKAGIKATICYDSIPLEELQEFCKQGGIQHMVVLKSRKLASVRKKISESRVQIKGPCGRIFKGSSPPGLKRPSPQRPLVTKEQAHRAVTSQVLRLSSEMNVSFNTQEKMAWNTKKRYESLMVVKVDLPGAVLRNMAAILDLDSNEDAFDASVATIADKNPRYKKYLGRVCDEIRKVSKKVPVVFVVQREGRNV